jgi:hypothetical protein
MFETIARLFHPSATSSALRETSSRDGTHTATSLSSPTLARVPSRDASVESANETEAIPGAASNAVHAASVHSVPVIGPVINQDGSIHRDNMRAFMERLIDACDSAVPEGTARRHHAAMMWQLHAIRDKIEDTSVALDLELQLLIRDCFDAAAGKARYLARYFRLHRQRGPHPVDERYRCLAAMLNQLKRIFLTNAAPQLSEQWARDREARIRARVRNIDETSRSYDMTSRSGGFVFKPGLVAKVGMSRYANVFNAFKDEDRNFNFWTARGVTVEGGGKAGIADLAGKAGIEIGDRYYETADMKDINKLTLMDDANRSWRNSAAPLARRASRKALYLSEKKIIKGYNPTQLHCTVDEIADFLEPAFADFVKRAFPAPVERLGTGRLEADDAERYRDPLMRTIPLSDPIGRSSEPPFRRYQVGFSASIGTDPVALHPDVAADIRGSVEVKGEKAGFYLENLEPANRFMDPAYHADWQRTFRLTEQLDARSGTAGMLHRYREMRARLEGTRAASRDLTPEEIDYFGPADCIPAQFLDSITSATPETLGERLDLIESACDALRDAYRNFLGHAMRFAAERDRFLPPRVGRRLDTARRNAFDAINRAVWGARATEPGSGYPGGIDAAFNDPEKFILESNHALSLELGLLGQHLAVVKYVIAKQMADDATPRHVYRASIQNADAAYHATQSLMKKPPLPIRPDEVRRKRNPFEDHANSIRYHFTTELSINGNIAINFIKTATNALFGKRTADSFDLINNTGKTMVSGLIRVRKAPEQVNPSRDGDFIQLDLSAISGPLTGLAIQEIALKAMKKAYPGLDIRQQESKLQTQLAGLVLDLQSGATLSFSWRKPANVEGGFALQWIHLREQQKKGTGLRIPFWTPAGTGSVEVGRHQTTDNVATEIMGPEIGYSMLQLVKLEEVTHDIARHAQEHGLDEERANKALAALLRGDMDNPLLAGFAGNRKVGHVADAYFSASSTITGIIDQYQTYADAVREAGDVRQLIDNNIPARNEFFRYFSRDTKTEPFARVAVIAPKALHYAPGSTVNLGGTPHDPFEAPPGPLSDILAMPEPLPDGRTWAQEKEHILSLKSREERTYYFCNDGKAVLDHYIRILATARKAHNLTRHSVSGTNGVTLFPTGFTTRLRADIS